MAHWHITISRVQFKHKNTGRASRRTRKGIHLSTLRGGQVTTTKHAPPQCCRRWGTARWAQHPKNSVLSTARNHEPRLHDISSSYQSPLGCAPVAEASPSPRHSHHHTHHPALLLHATPSHGHPDGGCGSPQRAGPSPRHTSRSPHRQAPPQLAQRAMHYHQHPHAVGAPADTHAAGNRRTGVPVHEAGRCHPHACGGRLRGMARLAAFGSHHRDWAGGEGWRLPSRHCGG